MIQQKVSIDPSTGKRWLRLPGALLFGVGVLLGLFLIFAAIWGDFEANFYGFDTFGAQRLKTLSCPVLMTRTETGKVSITLKNPSARDANPKVRLDVSNVGPYRQVVSRQALAPGETKQVEWEVTSEDIDLECFILVKVFTYASGALPFQEASCGILVLNLPGWSGGQLLTGLLGGTLLGIVLGLLLWQVGSQPLLGRKLETIWAMRLMAGVILLGVFSSLMGWTLIAVLFLVVGLLFVSVFVYLIVMKNPA